MKNLRKLCVDELMKQTNPSLDIVGLSEKYEIPELLEKSVKGCADKISPNDLEACHKKSVDWKVTDSSHREKEACKMRLKSG